jgi:putative PIN family toxin of toxin-antitoxin system
MISLVIDTSVLVSALLTRRSDAPTARILDAWSRGASRPVVSHTLIAEYITVLRRPKLAERHGLRPKEIDALVAALVRQCAVLDPPGPGPKAPDPEDQFLFDLVATLPGTALVTGDMALLGGGGVLAVTPAEAAARWL